MKKFDDSTNCHFQEDIVQELAQFVHNNQITLTIHYLYESTILFHSRLHNNHIKIINSPQCGLICTNPQFSFIKWPHTNSYTIIKSP